jgi:TonB family protein
MQRTTFVEPLSCRIGLFCILLFGLETVSLPAQDAAPVTETNLPHCASLPKDPWELMLLAMKSNGLTGLDVPPWHLKAGFKLLDEQGGIKDQGTYEEFWVSPMKYKRIYVSSTFNQIEYGTEKGILRSGDRSDPAWELSELRRTIVDPLPDQETIAGCDLKSEHRKAGNVDLICISMKAKSTAFTAALFPDTSYCFDRRDPFLRSRTLVIQSLNTVGNGVAPFHDRYLPADVMVGRQQKLVLTAHLETIEALNSINDALFVPTADAAAPSPNAPEAGAANMTVSPETASGLLVEKIPPVYPPVAKAAHIQGTVVLEALIDKSGKISKLAVRSGPHLLQQAALDAVQHWTYKPFLFNGKPTAVFTTVNVIFKLGQSDPQ